MIPLLLLIVLFGCMPAMAQIQTGSVSGQLRGPDGKPASSVQVALSGSIAGTSEILISQTDEAGMFLFEELRPMRYELVAGAIAAPTYFPGTADRSKAGDLSVTASKTTFANFALLTPVPAPGSAPIGDALWPSSRPPMRIISGTVIVEGVAHDFSSNPLEIFFSDGPGNQSTTLTLLPQAEKSAAASARIAIRAQFASIRRIVPMAQSLTGRFEIPLPEGEFRVSRTGSPDAGGYYLKSLSFGNADLMKELMKLKGPIKDELVITLARCTEIIPECR